MKKYLIFLLIVLFLIVGCFGNNYYDVTINKKLIVVSSSSDINGKCAYVIFSESLIPAEYSNVNIRVIDDCNKYKIGDKVFLSKSESIETETEKNTEEKVEQ
jgi:hypothetical protein